MISLPNISQNIIKLLYLWIIRNTSKNISVLIHGRYCISKFWSGFIFKMLVGLRKPSKREHITCPFITHRLFNIFMCLLLQLNTRWQFQEKLEQIFVRNTFIVLMCVSWQKGHCNWNVESGINYFILSRSTVRLPFMGRWHYSGKWFERNSCICLFATKQWTKCVDLHFYKQIKPFTSILC